MNHDSTEVPRPPVILPDIPVADPFVETIAFNAAEVLLAGWSSETDELGLITGSAAAVIAADIDNEASDPQSRAYFEFAERFASALARLQLDASKPARTLAGAELEAIASEVVFPRDAQPLDWRWSHSNGVALHTEWRLACRAALFEIYERDALLRSWAGTTAPRRLTVPDGDLALFAPSHRLELYDLACDRWSPSLSSVIGAQVALAWPLVEGAPFMLAAAADSCRERAQKRAIAECLQGTAFLIGAEWEESELRPTPHPSFHQAYYQRPHHRDQLRHWLDGGHVQGDLATQSVGQPWDERFVVLTPPKWRGLVHVVKAIVPAAQALFFGYDAQRTFPQPHPFA